MSQITLSNSGERSMTISGSSLTDTADFRLASSTCAATLAAGASCTYSLVFAPQTVGSIDGRFIVTDTSGGITGAQQTVALSGTGLGQLDPSLAVWENALRHCQTQVVNVVVLGDSRFIVDTTITPGVEQELADTFGQKWVDRLRMKLQEACGSHGSGLVPFRWGAGTHSLNGDFYTVTGSWTEDPGLGPSQGGYVPDSLTLKTQTTSSIDLFASETFDQLRMYCAEGPGLNSWSILIDGVAAASCGGAAAQETAVVASTGVLARTSHTVSARCSQAPCVGYGMETIRGTSGVSVHNLSVGSCTAECFGLNPASQLAYSDRIEGGHQLILFELVTNEPGVGYPVESFRAALGRIIENERGLGPAPSVLIYAPLQDIIAGQAPYYPVLPSVAASYAAAYFDLRETYGYTLLPEYFGPDQAHENNSGQELTYEKMITMLIP